MLNRIYAWIIVFLASFLLVSCSSDSFKIEGFLSDVGEQNLNAIYVNEAGVHDFKVPVESGKFTVEGVSANYTVVLLYNSADKLLAKAMVRNGDKLELRGTMKHCNLIEIEGTDVNEAWSDFRRENHLLYEDEKAPLLDKKIEEFIESNGGSEVCLPMLLYDFSSLDDTERVHSLLNMIKEEVRPASVMSAYADMNAMLSLTKEPKERFNSMMFYNENDSMESFTPMSSKMSVLCFWEIENDSREDIVEEFDSLYINYKGKKQLQIADVMLDGDTARWKRMLRREDTEWKHYLAVGGLMNRTVKDVNVISTPHFLVLDSIGQPIYSGDSIENVSHLVKTRLKKVDKKENKDSKDRKSADLKKK